MKQEKMIRSDKDNYYVASDGYTFRHRQSQRVYGRDIYLSPTDTINNYDEVVYDETTKTEYDRQIEAQEKRGY